MSIAFKENLAFGKVGESAIASWFRMRGFNTLPVYEVMSEGKGPVLYTAEGSHLIAPDLFVFGNGKVYWIEAKHKSAFSWYRIGKRWVTGIDLKHWQDYLRVQVVSPWPIWILFLHGDGRAKDSPKGSPTGLFGRDVEYLDQHESHRHMNWGRSGMVYWAHDDLLEIAPLEEFE